MEIISLEFVRRNNVVNTEKTRAAESVHAQPCDAWRNYKQIDFDPNVSGFNKFMESETHKNVSFTANRTNSNS